MKKDLNINLNYLDKYKGYIVSGFGRPFGINSDNNQNLYITDMDLNTVFKISSDLNNISWLDPISQHWLDQKRLNTDFDSINHDRYHEALHGPHAIDFDSQGQMYITTYYTPLIHVYDQQSGKKHYEIGHKNSHFPLEGPASAFIGNNNQLYVSEYRKNCIVRFGLNGDYIDTIHNFDRPHMAKVASDQCLYCVDTWNHRIHKYSQDGKLVGYLGYNPKDSDHIGWRKNENAVPSEHAYGFSSPVSVGFNGNDMVISDWGNNRIKIFSLSGELKSTIDYLNLKKPYDAQFWQSKLVIADSHNGRIIILDTIEGN